MLAAVQKADRKGRVNVGRSVRYCYHLHLTQEESEAMKHLVTFPELLRQEMAEQGFELEPEGLHIPPSSHPCHASSQRSFWFNSHILQMGKLRPRARYCLAQGHKVTWQIWTSTLGFWILSPSLLHCDALSPPNQITPGRQSGVRGCFDDRQQFWRLICHLGVTLRVLLYVRLTAEGNASLEACRGLH